MKELGMDFIIAPEFTEDRVKTIPPSTVFSLLNTDNATMTDGSLLDPENMWLFAALYEANLDGFSDNFNIDTDQAEWIATYLENQMEAATYTGEGIMLAKTIESTSELLRKNLPAEWTARNFAQRANYDTSDPLTCEKFFTNFNTSDAVYTIPSEQITYACTQLPLSNLDAVRLWVNGTWYSNYDYLMPASGLNSTQLDYFYNQTGTYGFSTYLQRVINAQRLKVFPNSPLNSTDDNGIMTAAVQWVNSSITQTTVYDYSTDSEFVKPSISINGWGAGTANNIPWLNGAGPPEPSYYANVLKLDKISLTPSELVAFFDNSYSWYGLTNTYNMRGLYMDWAAGSDGNYPGAFAQGFKTQMNFTSDEEINTCITVL